MNLSLKDLRKNFDVANPATSQEIAQMEEHFGYRFPTDYRDFLLLANGLEGGIDHEYLVLWGTSELISFLVQMERKMHLPLILQAPDHL